VFITAWLWTILWIATTLCVIASRIVNIGGPWGVGASELRPDLVQRVADDRASLTGPSDHDSANGAAGPFVGSAQIDRDAELSD